MPPKSSANAKQPAAGEKKDEPKRKKNEKIVLLVDKTGTVKEIGIKDTPQSLNELYKKAGFKSADGFQEQFVWEISNEDLPDAASDAKCGNLKYSVSLYAKKTGRIQKNMYGFPPPFEESVFYGNCILVCSERDLSVAIWDGLFEAIYEKYEENEEEMEDEEQDDAADDESVDLEELEDDEEGMDEEKECKVSSGKKKRAACNAKTKKDDPVVLFTDVVEHFLDCSSELELERYV